MPTPKPTASAQPAFDKSGAALGKRKHDASGEDSWEVVESSDATRESGTSEKELPSCVSGAAPAFQTKKRSREDSSYEITKESDPRKIEQRLKQIKFGKNTIGYDNYVVAVPKEKRKGFLEHPRTPDAYAAQSKRAFDGRLKVCWLLR
jgi:hypothetical protein